MWVECCDPLDLKRELCKECPHFFNCSSVTTEEIKEVLEDTDNMKDKNVWWRDKRDLL